MDIEKLKELSECGRELYMLNDENLIERIRENNQLQNYLSDSVDAIDEAIAHQSAKGEEVKKAIAILEKLKNSRNVYIDMGQHYAVPMKVMYGEFLDLAIAALQAYQPWIPVSEILPEEYRFVLISILDGKATGVGMIDKKKRWYGIDHQEMEIVPEAWKPLPAPLKGEMS